MGAISITVGLGLSIYGLCYNEFKKIPEGYTIYQNAQTTLKDLISLRNNTFFPYLNDKIRELRNQNDSLLIGAIKSVNTDIKKIEQGPNFTEYTKYRKQVSAHERIGIGGLVFMLLSIIITHRCELKEEKYRNLLKRHRNQNETP